MTGFGHILAPTDFSATARHALDYARTLASAFGARLYLMHVTPDAYTQPWVIAGARLAMPNIFETWEREARDQLENLRQGPETRLIIASGDPFLQIVRHAKSEKSDLIVMGTHGWGPIGAMLLGSVAQKVVRGAPCPVLTVRHPEHRFVMPGNEAAERRPA